MIKESDLPALLKLLGFSKNLTGDSYEKRFSDTGTLMQVDLEQKKLIYPEQIKGRERNDGFDKNENFVVFECVCRLLEKGYRPEHIELEKEWHLGHTPSGGRADICVTDPEGSMLFIVECKTWGAEYKKEYENIQKDGGQLFSYWQQEQACRWLALYASELEDETVKYNTHTVSCSDDANIKLLAETDKSIKLYKNAATVEEKYEVWAETYAGYFYDDLIFKSESVAYNIGIKPLTKKDLKDFTPDDKIINRFEEILRHNNVSDKENAFNRLIALFICKLVDEITKGDDDEVEFQYKQGVDSFETLQDRLQRLHRDGMEKFMKEKIFYISSDYPEWLFTNYTGAKRKKAIEDLQNTLRILKFYTNNDFAFKDVHNEELFFQNGKIVVEMVQLFEKHRIVYPSKYQFLGDLFEQLLNKGFKQNEGQFFTPMPITRFIWDALPVKTVISSDRGTVYPMIMDYACGAGHFLTEAVEAVNHFTCSENNAWVKDHIFGIEKDYRLARVAKISLFMNGAGEANIIFGDGLENIPEKGIENGTFDILTANPPYAVKDFTQHLKLKNNSFELLESIGKNGDEIQVLFVERTAQLLKPEGVAAVILPSSLLSNTDSSNTGAREAILKSFYIRAIVAFGSNTFGATGTNTVIVFLEKFSEPPKKTAFAHDTAEAVISGGDISQWEDSVILKEYIEHIEADENEYQKFLQKSLTLEDLVASGFFKKYVDAFAGLKETKDYLKSNAYKSLGETDKTKAYLERLLDYISDIEKEKLFYFALVHDQITVVIKAPADNKEQKQFLGYEWSNRRGQEGIKITNPGGMLYNDTDREAEGTLANAIKESFCDNLPVEVNPDVEEYFSTIYTKDLLDFSQVGFNKAIQLYTTRAISISSKYPVFSLGEVCDIKIGGTPSRLKPEYFTGQNLWVSVSELRGQVITDTKEKITDDAVVDSNVKLIPAGTTLLSFKLSIGKTAIAGKDLYTNEAIASLIPFDSHRILDKYINYYFKGKLIDLEHVGFKAFGKSLNSQYLKKEVKIPVPPISVQQQIISECEEIDREYESTRMTIDSYRQKIEDLFKELDVISEGGGRYQLSDTEKFNISIGKRVLNSQLVDSGKYPVYSANVTEPFGYIDALLISDFSRPSVTWGIDGDWMTNYMPENIEFYPTDHCGYMRCLTDEINPRYLAHVLEGKGRDMGFSRAFRASIERIKTIVFTAADRSLQDEYIVKISEYERLIDVAKQKLEELEGKTNDIVKKHLID